MPTYRVQIPEIHRVTVTVEANSPAEARARAADLTAIEALERSATVQPVYDGRSELEEWIVIGEDDE